jgi:hypothetical protein
MVRQSTDCTADATVAELKSMIFLWVYKLETEAGACYNSDSFTRITDYIEATHLSCEGMHSTGQDTSPPRSFQLRQHFQRKGGARVKQIVFCLRIVKHV